MIADHIFSFANRCRGDHPRHLRQMVEDENGAPIIAQISKGCMVYVPESRYHYTTNNSDQPMVVFAVYSPTGAEKVLRELPGCRIAAASC